jgi:hypothetical protein
MPAKAGIQYSATFMKIEAPAFTGSSAFADDDAEAGGQHVLTPF